MPSSESSSLRADIVRRWKAELYSPDTVVAVVAVLVALSAGVAAAFVDPAALYAVIFASAVGPNAGYRRGEYAAVDNWTAAKVGAAVALAVAAVTTAVVAGVLLADVGTGAATVAGVVVGLLFADVASRKAFDRVSS